MNELFERIRLLTEFPNQGFRRPKFTSLPLRFVPVGEYLIAYAPEKNPLWVVAVMHGRRSPRVVAAILRGRGGPRKTIIFANSQVPFCCYDPVACSVLPFAPVDGDAHTIEAEICKLIQAA